MRETMVVLGCGNSKCSYWEWPVDVETALEETRKSFAYVSDYGADTSTFGFIDRFEDIVSEDYPTFRAIDLYDSIPFDLKRTYGRRFGDRRSILSAEHGLIPAGRAIEPYDTHIDDVDIDEWVATVASQVEPPDTGYERFGVDLIEVLAGQDYIDPLREVFATYPAEVRYPFEEAGCGGIGEQNGWLRAELDEAFPQQANGWTFDPENSYNGHTWVGDGGRVALLVRCLTNSQYVSVHDERVSGMGGGEYVLAGPESDWEPETRKALYRRAAEWMRAHPPDEWRHPAVNEAVFDPPAGYALEKYYLSKRETTIYYHREGADEAAQRDDEGELPPPTPETYPYLVIHTWNGSGNSEISLAPWTRAHDHQMETVVEPPDECGIDIAVKAAREYARQEVADEPAPSTPQVGQADIGRWSG